MAEGDNLIIKNDENVTSIKEDSIPKQSLTLEGLRIIKDAQQQHGLRHDDHNRYRQYCSRRLRRLRKTLHFPQGNMKKVQPKKITENNLKDIKFLLIPLFEAERAWSYAMALKSEANTEHRKTYHKLNRLKKAVQHASLLALLCSSAICDARSKLEAQAYESWMTATLQFELENWKDAMTNFQKAQTIYNRLYDAITDDSKELYRQKCDEILPSLRYCEYSIGDKNAMEDLRKLRMTQGGAIAIQLDELIEKTKEKQVATLSEVSWRGKLVPIKSESIRLRLLSVQELERSLTETNTIESKLSIYESLLKELIDAAAILKEENRDDPTFRSVIRGHQIEGRLPQNVHLYSYIMYKRLTHNIDRYLLMIAQARSSLDNKTTIAMSGDQKKSKPHELARLYDTIIQNTADIMSLPALDDDFDLKKECELNTAVFRTNRCFYAARTYESVNKWNEAIALYDLVQTRGIEAMEYMKDPSGNQELVNLLKDADGRKSVCRVSKVLDVHDFSKKMKKLSVKDSKLPLDERLESFGEDKNVTNESVHLTSLPPEFEPISAKPLFFDLALSLVEFPNLDDKIGDQKKQAASGLSGMIKSLWGWGRK